MCEAQGEELPAWVQQAGELGAIERREAEGWQPTSVRRPGARRA